MTLDSRTTSLEDAFRYCFNLLSIPLLSTTDTSSVTNLKQAFSSCTSIVEIPQINTENVTNMAYMCYNDYYLRDVPQLNTSKVTTMQSTFSSCPNLSDNSLNNILAMCANATAYTATKTLTYIGLSATQKTTCQSLSNYQAFLDAGWTL